MTIWARAMIGRLRLHSSILQARKRVRRPTEPCAPAAGVLQKVGAMLQPSVGHGQLARPPRPSASRTRSARTQRRKASAEHRDVIGGITARIWDASVRVSTPRSLNGEQRRPGPTDKRATSAHAAVVRWRTSSACQAAALPTFLWPTAGLQHTRLGLLLKGLIGRWERDCILETDRGRDGLTGQSEPKQ
jgi:hypothetical protein